MSEIKGPGPIPARMRKLMIEMSRILPWPLKPYRPKPSDKPRPELDRWEHWFMAENPKYAERGQFSAERQVVHVRYDPAENVINIWAKLRNPEDDSKRIADELVNLLDVYTSQKNEKPRITGEVGLPGMTTKIISQPIPK